MSTAAAIGIAVAYVLFVYLLGALIAACICVAFDVPARYLLALAWGAEAVIYSLSTIWVTLRVGDPKYGVPFAILAALCAYWAVDEYRKNNNQQRRPARWLSKVVVDLGGRLGVADT